MIKKIRVKNGKKEAILIRNLRKIPQNSLIVNKVIKDVIRFGDNAIRKYTEKYDNVKSILLL